MADLNLITIAFEFVPPLVVTLAYLLFFRGRRNRFVEAFIALLYFKTVTFFLFALSYQSVYQIAGFDPHVDLSTLYWLFIAEFLFQFAYGLQEFLTWIMISFFAVLFGMLVLALKMALQDPLKMKFSNIIKRLVGKEPVSDGYSGFRDRLNHLTFEGVPENPLNPDVQKQAWSSAWKDYLIIGLATLLPSIPAYVGTLPSYIAQHLNPALHGPDAYILCVLIFLTWIYRFGYPASNRIAKGAGLKLGDRDIGSEMMRGVLGWFFRLNILLTFVFFILDAIHAVATNTIGYLVNYYIDGVRQAFPPIVFAIIMLPLVERFSVILYKNTFESLNNAGSKIREMNIRRSIMNLVASLGTGGLMALAFVGAILGVTLHTAASALGILVMYPRDIAYQMNSILTSAANNVVTITPGFWVLLILSITLGIMILTGVVGHYVRDRFNGGMESFALVAGFVVSVVSYFMLPGLDYQIGPVVTNVEFGGVLFNRLRPILVIPTGGPEQMLYRLAYEFIVNVPIFISAALFVMYYFEYRERWREESGEERGPLLSVHAVDVIDAVKMFVFGIIGSVIGVFILSFLMDPGTLGSMIDSLIIEIGLPDGLELILSWNVSLFLILAEHNLVRTLLMLVIGPVFWSLVLWFIAVQKQSSEKRIGQIAVVLAVIGTIAAFFWTNYDLANGVVFFGPYPAELGARAGIILGSLFGLYALIGLFNLGTKGSLGGWWFPPLLTLFFIEYFVYDDQFTLIALIILPMIIAGFYRLIYANREEVKSEDFLITYIRFSLMSLAIAEVLSTALWLAGIGALNAMYGDPVRFFVQTFPHGVIEIPAFLFTAAASIRIARDLAPSVQAERWDEIPSKTKSLLTDGRLWRTYLFILFFLLIAAMIEAYITPLVEMMMYPP
ncbi:MAG: stage II sporulation protein M [Candidatus Thorarchaeota archaeon]|nr:stage II sporulation protein M [Candidatus Thorarchaeota archaeon]